MNWWNPSGVEQVLVYVDTHILDQDLPLEKKLSIELAGCYWH